MSSMLMLITFTFPEIFSGSPPVPPFSSFTAFECPPLSLNVVIVHVDVGVGVSVDVSGDVDGDDGHLP